MCRALRGGTLTVLYSWAPLYCATDLYPLMTGISASDRLLSFLKPLRRSESDRAGVVKSHTGENVAAFPVAVRAAEILETEKRTGVVFQSVIVACVQTIDRVRLREEQVAEASISLAQREKLHHLLAELDAVSYVLRNALTTQGTSMLRMGSSDAAPHDESRWWYALAEAIQELEDGSERMASLVGAQPRGASVRRLAGSVVRLLHKHHARLVLEAEAWMES